MPFFSIHTLGCRVNHYESEQVASVLRSKGWQEADPALADLRIINTCSVTNEAASKSRQSARCAIRLPVLRTGQIQGSGLSDLFRQNDASDAVGLRSRQDSADHNSAAAKNPHAKVIVIGCWATSHRAQASALPGVHAVITHHDNVNQRLEEILAEIEHLPISGSQSDSDARVPGAAVAGGGWPVACEIDPHSTPLPEVPGRGNQSASIFTGHRPPATDHLLPQITGTHALPILSQRQSHHQRAFLKIQDGCDAHCTYCIIPSLRPALWSKPVASAVEEAQRLVDAGHREIILTGIFLGAYGQATALRRRQKNVTPRPDSGQLAARAQHRAGSDISTPDFSCPPALRNSPLADLIEQLCTSVKGLHRLRLSSLEPGDLDGNLLATLRSHKQVVPHFHLPLQSGSSGLLRRMNRQYTREDFLTMIDRVQHAFDRPALTTDIIAGFPGETDDQFEQTLDIVRRARFIHIHAFPFSPRPGTAAARWTKDFIPGDVASARIAQLQRVAADYSLEFRKSFEGETVEVLVERESTEDSGQPLPIRHGRCERYFDVHFAGEGIVPGELAAVRVVRVEGERTWGHVE